MRVIGKGELGMVMVLKDLQTELFIWEILCKIYGYIIISTYLFK